MMLLRQRFDNLIRRMEANQVAHGFAIAKDSQIGNSADLVVCGKSLFFGDIDLQHSHRVTVLSEGS